MICKQQQKIEAKYITVLPIQETRK